MPDTLDDLLASAAPIVSLRTPDAEAALATMVADARLAVARERRRKVARRSVGAAAVVALMAVGTAAAAGVLPFAPTVDPWNALTDEAESQATLFEWRFVDDRGVECVARLTGAGLTEAQIEHIESSLADPGQLLVNDSGAVREEFLRKGWALESEEEVIDAAYAEVGKLDFAAGLGRLDGAPLTVDHLPHRADEVYHNVYWRLVLDGMGAGPHNGHPGLQDLLTPESACEVSE